jgi:hypothetical protein
MEVQQHGTNGEERLEGWTERGQVDNGFLEDFVETAITAKPHVSRGGH